MMQISAIKLVPTLPHHFENRFLLTSNEEVSVELAGDSTADVICVFLVGVELCGVRHVPQATGVVVGPREDLVTV